MRKMNYIYFSGSGTTKEVVSIMAGGMTGEAAMYDLLRNPPKEDIAFSAQEPAVFAFPVFGGRIPVICPEMLEKFHGAHTPAVAVVVYGNRAYDDALLELKDILEAQGFAVIAAAAFVAQHSIFPSVARNRPDDADRQKILDFAAQCEQKLNAFTGKESVAVKGNRPYVKASPASIHPTGNKACNGCGACVKVCPVQAISADSPRKTDTKKCIACTACMAVCPQHARGFHIPVVYSAAEKSFAKSNAARKEPEIFL